jgi:beta-1,4-mannooligosaccharide/beta-1,4-mannosyl-N-acetylglucosamine phosphorylase
MNDQTQTNVLEQVEGVPSTPIIHRHPRNPILTSEDIPYESKLVYNAGVTKFRNRYVMVFRNDHGFDERTKKAPHFQLGVAYSDDGVEWQVEPEPILEPDDPEIMGNYDARLTVLEDRCYITYTQHTRHGYRATIAVTDDFQSFEILHRTVPDNRNVVLFPEKIDGRYVRLERPFPVYSRERVDLFDIWISDSPDLAYWGNSDLLLRLEDVPFANEKLGAGSPPVRTDRGWLVIFHAVDTDLTRGKHGWEEKWQKRYVGGAMLLDLENPRKVIGVSKTPLLVPEAPYEVGGGFRNNVVFPTGLIVEDSGEVKIYYGAADTVVCLASARLDELLQFASASL